jgi:hypothetical protein
MSGMFRVVDRLHDQAAPPLGIGTSSCTEVDGRDLVRMIVIAAVQAAQLRIVAV